MPDNLNDLLQFVDFWNVNASSAFFYSRPRAIAQKIILIIMKEREKAASSDERDEANDIKIDIAYIEYIETSQSISVKLLNSLIPSFSSSSKSKD